MRKAVFTIPVMLAVALMLHPLNKSQASLNSFLDQTSLDFGSHVLLVKSTKTVTFTNTTAQPLNITDISITGTNAGDFFLELDLDGQDCFNSTVGPGSSCLIRISFSPFGEGQRTATASVSFDADGSPVTINLSGEGTLIQANTSPPSNFCAGTYNPDLPLDDPNRLGGDLIFETIFPFIPATSYHITGTVEGVSIDFTSPLSADLTQTLQDALAAYGLDPALASSLIINQGIPSTQFSFNSKITAEKSTDALCLNQLGGHDRATDMIPLQGTLVFYFNEITYAFEQIPVTIGQVSCTLDPAHDINPVGSDHSLTVKVISSGFDVSGQVVNFEVISGPNLGTANVGVADTNGETTFTYTGFGGIGTDTIRASGSFGGVNFSCTATKQWISSSFDLCLQDASNPSVKLLLNSTTGDFLYCDGNQTLAGTGEINRKAEQILLKKHSLEQLVNIHINLNTYKGQAVVKSPRNRIQSTIFDADIRDNTCDCESR